MRFSGLPFTGLKIKFKEPRFLGLTIGYLIVAALWLISAGNPTGIPEDKTKCVAEVTDFTGWHQYQCSRKRGHGSKGEYCKQHAKIERRNEP
jgi:hypothetical protein